MSNRNKIRIGTDCSGIEAPIQSLSQLGIPFKHVFSSDIDKYCRKSIIANYDPEILYEDITKRNVKELPDIDLYVCGFPCQTFSMAGRRKGTKEKRGQIFWYCLDVIKEKLPSVFILENVKGLLSIDDGKTFNKIIKTLSSIKKYDVIWKVLNTKDYGIPQNRERLFIIGTRIDKKIRFDWPSCKKMKDVYSYIDWSNKTPYLSKRAKIMEKKVPKDAAFIDLSFREAVYPYSNIYTPSIVRSGALWCVPLHRYATVLELLSLQGFSKSFKQDVSDSQLKKQLGNTMSVCVLNEIFKKLYK
jgi:DNA (cytosine-5)-methyltransferase 1